MSFKKFIGKGALACTGATVAVGALPGVALAKAKGWTPRDLMGCITDDAMDFNDSFTFSTIATWVQTITTAVLGIAIFLFLLRIALTAVNNLLAGGAGGGKTPNGGGSGLLEGLPVVGAYPVGTPWMDIWKQFGKNVAVVLGAWIIVQVIVSIAMFIFNQLGASTAAGR